MTPFVWRVRRILGTMRDAIHGVDTTLGIKGDLGINGCNKSLGVVYEPLPWAMLGRLLKLIPEPIGGFTFVDVGCGKGRALVEAIRFPFRSIVGIEYSEALANVARRNVADARLVRQRCFDAAVTAIDAMDFVPPDEPTIYLLNNPFQYDLTRLFVRNIAEATRKSGKVAYLIFCSVPYRDRLTCDDALSVIANSTMRCDLLHRKGILVAKVR